MVIIRLNSPIGTYCSYEDIKKERNIALWFFNVNFHCFEQHKQNCTHLLCIGVAVETSQADISKSFSLCLSAMRLKGTLETN